MPGREVSGLSKETKKRSSEKNQLVESFRNTEGQPRQRVVVSLGDAQIPAAEQKAISRAVEARLRGESDLFEEGLSEEGAAWVTRIVKLAERSKAARPASRRATIDGVLVDQIETENVVSFGAELVALEAWNELGLTAMFEEAGLSKQQIATAKLMVANRLIEPLSEWALIDWAERTALPELLDLRMTKTTKDRLYRTSDKLLEHREFIEKKLRDHEQTLFSSRRKLVLYDVTNTHFEGLCESNPKAKHGKNKQKRNDCRQVAVGMAFDEQGNALAHEVFAGDMADTSTLSHILSRLDQLEVGEKPIVVLMRGLHRKATSPCSRSAATPTSSTLRAAAERNMPPTLPLRTSSRSPVERPTCTSKSKPSSTPGIRSSTSSSVAVSNDASKKLP